MTDLQRLKRRIVHTAQRLVVNPVGRRSPMTMLETTGRKSGEPRRTAIGGRVIGNQFWMVSEHGDHSHYVLNIKANPASAGTHPRQVAQRNRAPAAGR